jgi:hypothetical protein
MSVFKELIQEWEKQNGRKATLRDEENMLLDILAKADVYPRADGCIYKEDIERAIEENSLKKTTLSALIKEMKRT